MLRRDRCETRKEEFHLQGTLLEKKRWGGLLHREFQRSAEDPCNFWLGSNSHTGNNTKKSQPNNSRAHRKIAAYPCKVLHCMFRGILFEMKMYITNPKIVPYPLPAKILPSHIFTIFSLLYCPNCRRTSQLYVDIKNKVGVKVILKCLCLDGGGTLCFLSKSPSSLWTIIFHCI